MHKRHKSHPTGLDASLQSCLAEGSLSVDRIHRAVHRLDAVQQRLTVPESAAAIGQQLVGQPPARRSHHLMALAHSVEDDFETLGAIQGGHVIHFLAELAPSGESMKEVALRNPPERRTNLRIGRRGTYKAEPYGSTVAPGTRDERALGMRAHRPSPSGRTRRRNSPSPNERPNAPSLP